jgi:hypothetical protein
LAPATLAREYLISWPDGREFRMKPRYSCIAHYRPGFRFSGCAQKTATTEPGVVTWARPIARGRRDLQRLFSFVALRDFHAQSAPVAQRVRLRIGIILTIVGVGLQLVHRPFVAP